MKDQNHDANGVATSAPLVGRCVCFLTAQSHHRYPQVVHRTLKLVTWEPQMESPRDDNLIPDKDYMYTVTTCRCLCVVLLLSAHWSLEKLSSDTVHAHCAHTLQSMLQGVSLTGNGDSFVTDGCVKTTPHLRTFRASAHVNFLAWPKSVVCLCVDKNNHLHFWHTMSHAQSLLFPYLTSFAHSTCIPTTSGPHDTMWRALQYTAQQTVVGGR